MKAKLKSAWAWVWAFLTFPFGILFSARYYARFKVAMPSPYNDIFSWQAIRVPWYQRWYRDSVRLSQERINELEKKYPNNKGIGLEEIRRIE